MNYYRKHRGKIIIQDLSSQKSKSIKSPSADTKLMPSKPERFCLKCGSKHVWNDGHYVYDGKSSQVYRCKNCGRKFSEKSLHSHCGMRFPKAIVDFALAQYLRLHSFSEVSKLLSSLGITVSDATVGKWARKFGGDFDPSPTNRSQISDKWLIGKQRATIAGNDGWLFEIRDDRRNVVSIYFSEKDGARIRKIAAQRAKEILGVSPTSIKTTAPDAIRSH